MWRDNIIGVIESFIPNPIADIRTVEQELEEPIYDMTETAKAEEAKKGRLTFCLLRCH